jgi:hypothetical protein
MSYLSPDDHAPAPTETALIVPLPAAEPLVADFRDRLDAAAGWGVPAHVTVVYPFADPSAIDERMLATLEALFQSVSEFDCQLPRTNWFADDVLWLDPEPAAPFRRLTAAVVSAFPECQPYRGVHDDVIPHLTVGERHLADLSTLRSAEQVVRSGLPIAAHAEHVLLIAGTHAANSWRIVHPFRLATTTD